MLIATLTAEEGHGGRARPFHGRHRWRLRCLPDRHAVQPSVAYPQVVAGGDGHAQDAEGAGPASGTGLPRIPAMVRADNDTGPVLAGLRFPGPVRQGSRPTAPGAVAAV